MTPGSRKTKAGSRKMEGLDVGKWKPSVLKWKSGSVRMEAGSGKIDVWMWENGSRKY
jgi:hypothetical protein